MKGATEISVKIRNLAVGGAGVGEVVDQLNGASDLLGITAFVPFTAVGETARARVVERKDRYLHAELLEILEPSRERVDPPCKYFGTCGGCELQHLDYAEQLRAKRAMIIGALRAAQLSTLVLDTVKEIRPGESFGYRRRIKLHVDAAGKVGFYRAQSRSVVEIDSCLIADRRLSAELPNIRKLAKLLQGKINSINVEVDEQGIVASLTAAYDMSNAAAQEIIAVARQYFPNCFLVAGGADAGGSGRQIVELPLTENAGGRNLMISIPAGGFSQVNWKVNQAIINRVVSEVDPESGTVVYDLYAGAGNFSIPLAAAGAQVIAVECDRRLVQLGRESAKANGLGKRLQFEELSVEKFLKRQKIPSGATLIVDPPRSGLGPLVSELTSGEKMLLISCQLPSFVRDLRKLLELGWHVTAIEPFDMFAQTSYVEVLAVLVKELLI